MPVRVKQRAVDVEKSSNKHWDELLRVSVALLLAWPGAVAVTLRDSGGGQAVTLRTASCLGRTLDGPEDAVVRAARLFHQAGLCELTDVESWVPVSAVAPGVSVRGCVSLVPVATRRIQFIGVGVEPILDDRHGNVLFEEVNRMFSNSAFGTVEDDRDRETEERRDTLDGFPSRSSKVRKGLDRWPMFYVGVSVEDQARSFGLEEVLDERRNHLATVVGLLQAMFYSFLERHHFRPHHFQLGSEGQVGDLNRLGNSRSGTPQGGPVSGSSRAPSSNSVSPISRNNSGKSSKHAGQSRSKSAPSHKENRFTKSQSPSPFMQWSRIKAGPVRDYSSKPVSGGQTEERAGTKNGETTSDVANRGGPGAATAHGRLVGPDGSLLRRPFDDFISTESKGQAEKPLPLAAPGDANSGESNAFVWTNPITKARSLVDARTGFVLPTRQLQISESESGRNTGHSRAPSAGDKSSGAQNQWVRDLLAAWKNPVFESVGPSIPRLAEIADVLPPGDDFGCDDACNRGGHSVKLDGRVSKDALRHSEFIAQVDRKFLLVKIPSRAPSRRGGDPPCESALLVLVDQHAADERCRVEALFRNYFEAANGVWKARTSELEKPLHFDLSTQEQNLLRRFRSHFEYWGITYEVAPPEDRTSRGESSRTSRFRVLSLPPSIVERCRLEPKLVVDLVRKEVWAWADLDRSVPVPGLVGVREEEHAWVERFHGCPQGILDLVNSRACRSKRYPSPPREPELTFNWLQAPSCSTIYWLRRNARLSLSDWRTARFPFNARMDGRLWFPSWSWDDRNRRVFRRQTRVQTRASSPRSRAGRSFEGFDRLKCTGLQP